MYFNWRFCAVGRCISPRSFYPNPAARYAMGIAKDQYQLLMTVFVRYHSKALEESALAAFFHLTDDSLRPRLRRSCFRGADASRVARRRCSVRKWAGADSNCFKADIYSLALRVCQPSIITLTPSGRSRHCGYAHPKAEGYQATPPARSRGDDTDLFNAFGPANRSACLRFLQCSKSLVAVCIQIVMGHRDRLIGV